MPLIAEFAIKSPSTQFVIHADKLPQYDCFPFVTGEGSHRGRKQNGVVSNDNESSDEEIFPYHGFALTKEDKGNKNLQKSFFILFSTGYRQLEKNRPHI